MSQGDLIDSAPPAPLNQDSSTVQHGDIEALLTGLLQISEMVGSVMMLDDILDRIVQITCEMMAAPVSSIYLLNDEGTHLVLRSNMGFETELRGVVGFDLDEGIVGNIARNGEVLALADATLDPRYKPLPSTLELGCRAYLVAPLRIQEQIIGVMTIRKQMVYEFSPTEILFFITVCKQVAIVIEKARMYEKRSEAERLAAVAISMTGVAHYIKNVLQTMKGGEYLVERGLENEDMSFLREGWDVLKRANRKIRGLVENILNYVRQSSPVRRQISLNQMIMELLGSLGRHADDHNVALSPELDPTLEDVWVDAAQLYDALLNLVTNAIDACERDRSGKVTIRTRQLEGRHQVLVEVIDNGHGIPEDIQPKIFNLFFSTKGQAGTGIGLAATKKIVEDHGGAISLESTLGQGTRFSIFLSTLPPID